MKTPLRNFALAASVGLSVLALAQTPVHAQYRAVPPRVAPVFRPLPRTPIVVPPVRSYTNPYVLPGMTLNQLGTLSALSMDPMLMASINSYYNMYRPIYITPGYPAVPYATPLGVSPLANGPYNFYNPYFAAFGLYP